ncbi:type VII secretion protein EccCb [Nocardioides zeae]
MGSRAESGSQTATSAAVPPKTGATSTRSSTRRPTGSTPTNAPASRRPTSSRRSSSLPPASTPSPASSAAAAARATRQRARGPARPHRRLGSAHPARGPVRRGCAVRRHHDAARADAGVGQRGAPRQLGPAVVAEPGGGALAGLLGVLAEHVHGGGAVGDEEVEHAGAPVHGEGERARRAAGGCGGHGLGHPTPLSSGRAGGARGRLVPRWGADYPSGTARVSAGVPDGVSAGVGADVSTRCAPGVSRGGPTGHEGAGAAALARTVRARPGRRGEPCEHHAAQQPPHRRTRGADRADRAAAAAADPGARGRQRRAHERDPDARQHRLDRRHRLALRPGRHDRRTLHARRGHVPLRDARLRRRADRPAAQAAQPAGDGLADGVPALPGRHPPGRARVRRPAARGADLAPPVPRRPARRRRGPHPPVGARLRRRPLPAGALGRLPATAVRRAGAAGERPHRPGRSRRRLGPAPPARRAPRAARAARVRRPAGLRPRRGVRPRGAGPLARAGDAHERGGLPRARAGRRRGALLRGEPRALGLAEVAAARAERAAVRRRRSHADGEHLDRRPRRAAAARPGRASPLRRGRAPGDPHVVLVVDGGILPPGNHVIPPDGLHGVTVIDLPARWEELEDPTRLRLEVVGEEADGRPRIDAIRVRTEIVHGTGDQCSIASAEALARRLTPLHTVASGDAGEGTNPAEMSGPTDFMDMLGLGDVHGYDPAGAWRPRPARDRLRVPIGVGDGGLVHLDIKESAQQGMGPHGLVIGATGSGKSEFLRTLVLGLAMTHSSEQLNMVLVDFKGGATFAGMSEMPHVSAVITNLSQELTLVDRMQDALSGEMVRRQELLREAGNYASIRDYERARAGGEDLAPLPSLFIVVDEFSEMLTAKPEFIDLFVAIGRLGRSLGLHLLLASQRLEEGRLRGLESHLSYRVGLRTFSAGESRAVLGVPDAYELPAVPGLGYLKPDQSTLLRFKAAYVSGPPPASSRATVRRDEGGNVRGILPFTISEVQTLEPLEEEETPVQEVRPTAQGEQPSLLDIAVDRMHDKGPSAHSVWLPPLDVPDTLDQLMADLTTTPDAGLVSPHWRSMGGLVVPLGTVDRPREQRRDTLTIDMAGAGGHVAVVGGPRSGKSTLLRTIVTSTALTTTPLESQFFVLDFGGGTFAPLARLPHVAGVGTRAEPDVVRRIIAEVQGIVDRREAYFRNQGIDSIETYRTRRRQGRADDGYGDVFLVVDGWSTLRSDFDDIEMSLQQLAGRGLTFGLHIVVGASRWPDFRAAMRDVFGTRLELRLGDPIDSEIDRKIAALVPTGRPGRGLVPGKLHFLGALPRVDATPDPATIGDGVDDLVQRVSAAWTGPTGPKLRLLPERIEAERVLAQAAEVPLDGGRTLADSGRILLGVNEKELAPVGLDVDAEPHLLVFGDGRSGKSALLRSYVREVMRTRTPKQAQVVVVDYRRSLLGEVPDDYQLNYLTSAAQATPLLRDLAKYLENRIPGPDVTPDQLRNRSWWQGSEVFVVVDDYDLVSTGQNSPVQPLQPLLAQARDVGLHLVVARRSGGASRALYEPVIQSLRDLAMPGIVLSGSPDEGALIGNVRPQKGPPGRGRLVTRDRGTEVVQLSWSAPTDL